MKHNFVSRLSCISIFSITLFFYAPASPADQPPIQTEAAAFQGLKSLHLAPEDITLFYDPALSVVLRSEHPESTRYSEGGIYISRPLRSQLLGKGKGYFTIDCDSGGSWDPGCKFLQETPDGLKEAAYIQGLRFSLPGKGAIYVSGHNNTMFDLRRKYEWRDGTFIETKQPFYFVGLDTKTNRAVDIFYSQAYTQVVASLPKATALTVILNDGEHYLLKTPFGLLGWVKIPDGTSKDESPIAGIYYAGD